MKPTDIVLAYLRRLAKLSHQPAGARMSTKITVHRNRRRLLPPLLLGAGLLLATTATGAETTASPDPSPPPGLLVTHADASTRLPNTVSDVSVSVEVHGRDLRATAGMLARQSQSLQDFLHGQKTERLRTEVAGFAPEMQDIRNAPDRIKGYAGTQTISFRTTPDRLSALLAGSLDNGATSVSQSGSFPRAEEVEAAHADLVARAAKAAMAQARAAAAAVGQRVTGVERLVIDPQPGRTIEPMMERMLARPAPPMAAAPVPPITTVAGDAEVRATVQLIARIAPAE